LKTIWKTIIWLSKKLRRKFLLQFFLLIFIGVFVSLINVSFSIATKYVIDKAQKGNLNGFWVGAIIFAALLLANVILRAVDSILSARFTTSVENVLRRELFENLTRSDWSAFLKYHSDDFLTRLTSDVSVVAQGITGTLPDMVALGANILAAMAVLLFYSPMLAVFAFVLGPAGVLFSRIWGREIKQYHLKIQESESGIRENLHESLQNMLIVKAFRLEERSAERVNGLQKEKLINTIHRAWAGTFANIVLSVSYYTGYCLAFFWGAFQIAVTRGAFSFGTFSAFLQLVGQVQGPFSALASSIPQLIQSYASAGRLMEIDAIPQETAGSEPVRLSEAGLRFANVNFAYRPQQPILNGASFEVKPGEISAVTGPSGEGKTTMAHLMLCLLKPELGSISFIDGSGGTLTDANPRVNIAYVPQGNTLFSGTISDNLRLGAPGATNEEMEEALRAACAWKFVRELPEGLETTLGEHGIGLSEGQAQRIAIARAFIKKSPVLILDEATSALDGDTEFEVLSHVNEMGRTCIIITHRMSALSVCNRVYRISEGKITDTAQNPVEEDIVTA
jgi:ABC-type multidrug transport system fused ATPase/permease subunit